jgi:hypothetical protein
MTAEAKTARWRIVTAWVLVVVATIVALGASLDVWVNRQALDTDNWVATSSNMLENDQIRQALSVYLVDQLYANVDVQAQLEQRLPDQLDPVAAPLAAGLHQAAIGAADGLLGRPRTLEAWRFANRRAHKLFIAVIDNKTNRLETANGEVVLDLRPLIANLAREVGLGGKLSAKLPPDAGRLVILKADQLGAAQTAVRAIRAMSYFLGILVLALYALAVFLAGTGRRRTMIMASGFSLLLVGITLLVIQRLAGQWVVDSLMTNVDFKPAAAAAWGIGTQLLRNIGINLLTYGTAIAAAAWLVGESRPTTAIRRWLAPTLREHPVVVYAVVTVGLFIFLAAGPTDASRLIPLLMLFGFAYFGVEVLRRQTAREFPVTG